ncbi:MAG: GxxExxY protein [Verrucomicrobiota bacterium]|nr:GxxExxY protein [Verrucomicrobiota bacterium]
MELLHKELTGRIIGVAMEVHNELGCGFLEAIYQDAIELELNLQKLLFVRQKPFRVFYKGVVLKRPYIPDLIIGETVVVDLKAIAKLGAIEEAQMINYLKTTGLAVGLVINFGAPSLQWKRVVQTNSNPNSNPPNPRNPRS